VDCRHAGHPMTPLEAMARAIASKRTVLQWDDCCEAFQTDCMEEARAALAALRDNGVTEGMVEAWQAVPLSYGSSPPMANCQREFRAMLDAALQE